MKQKQLKKDVLGKEDSEKIKDLDELTPINETMYDNLRPVTTMKELHEKKKK
jgi:hypothetical protein